VTMPRPEPAMEAAVGSAEVRSSPWKRADDLKGSGSCGDLEVTGRDTAGLVWSRVGLLP
jgi:hypothetical protein